MQNQKYLQSTKLRIISFARDVLSKYLLQLNQLNMLIQLELQNTHAVN